MRARRIFVEEEERGEKKNKGVAAEYVKYCSQCELIDPEKKKK